MNEQLICNHEMKDSSMLFSVEICNLCPCVAYPQGHEKALAEIKTAIAKVRSFQNDNDALHVLGNRVLNDPSFWDEESIERDLAVNLIRFNENLSSVNKGLPSIDFDSQEEIHFENVNDFRALLDSLQWLVNYIDNITK